MGELAMRNIKTWKIDFDEQMEVYISSLKKSDNTKMVISSSFYKTFFDFWPGLIGCSAAGMLPKTSNLSFESGWNFTQSSKRSWEPKNLKQTNFRPEMTILTTLGQTFSSAVTSSDPRGQLLRSQRKAWWKRSNLRQNLQWCTLFPNFQRSKRKKCQNS